MTVAPSPTSVRPGWLAVALLGLLLSPALADEGMWTLDNPPLTKLQKAYGFEPTPEWFEHVRLSSVRFNDGGSGSFISPDGLILTNHHVGLNSLQKLSAEGKDYVKNGFYAKSREEEPPCPDLELNVLVSIQDVTARVTGAVKPGATDKEANDQRKAETSRIQKEEMEKTGLRCDVVSLYQGGEYALYRYKKYTDVRIVFAPEQQTAFFGGDPDNFTYPRYDLDMAVFRAYEDGKPARTPHYLKWSREGAKEGELVFVSGHPGSTSRQQTLAQLEFQRDVQLPNALKSYNRRIKLLKAYSALGPEQERRAKNQVFGIENTIKASLGAQKGLLDPRTFAIKGAEEKKLRDFVAAQPELTADAGGAWDAIAKARETLKTFAKRAQFSTWRGSRLFSIAGTIVRLTAELEKPNEDRLQEYRDSELDSLKFNLFSPAPIYPDLDETVLADVLLEDSEELGAEDPFVKAALEGKTPAEVAKAAETGTKLADPAVRKALVEGGRAAVEASDDPMIRLARRVDPVAREVRKKVEDEIESVETASGDKIAKARFKAYSRNAYPDATFTLRLAFGTCKGYMSGDYNVPYKTTFQGLYERSSAFDGKPPYDLPQRWIERKGAIDLTTPYNFVSSADIIGGNSGSPVINRNAELVGLIFDGNIESLGNRYVHDESVYRAVAVHSSGMLEALRGVYQVDGLVQEILGRQ